MRKCSCERRGSENSYNWRASVGGGCSSGAHLRGDETGVDARAGQGAVHLVVAHHGKWAGVGAGDGQRGPQRRGGWKAETRRTVGLFHADTSPSLRLMKHVLTNTMCVTVK